MSSGRKVAVTMDLGLLEKVATGLGYSCSKNAQVLGYYGQGRPLSASMPLVIHEKQSGYDVGFDGQNLVADFHGGYVEGMLTRVMAEYHRSMLESNYLCVERVETKSDRIRLVVRR